MKNKVKDYVGLSEEDKKYLREFDNAIERGYFKEDLVKLTKEMKEEIDRERTRFKRDLMFKGKRKAGDISDMDINERIPIGKKKGHDLRDGSGKFTKKEKNENSGSN